MDTQKIEQWLTCEKMLKALGIDMQIAGGYFVIKELHRHHGFTTLAGLFSYLLGYAACEASIKGV